ncbi:tricarballylate dehydrogenase [Desulfosarcina widdelii]|uniref:Tricarballylate dehydrogenase n=1 Tax=Desulfosarcina widdelii TaxID=947919 RepID=A0A5K7Z849_9BACT|nr:FAD-dependent tricarballylate dehydrogenase TcuA [Desulfosarcina widdelii]BBO72667.1 tricarballylate dehydrogenase [Desulfosarcina widdelii]
MTNRNLTGLTTINLAETFDVLVVGGGNAALCAAMTAREAGASVLLLESAPFEFRGGNSRHTRNLRYLHNESNSFLTGPYREKEFWEDLIRVTGGKTNEKLARFTIRDSNNLGAWMERHGCKFQPSMRGTLHLSRTNAFFMGGGKALMNAYYATAEKLGVVILYDAEVVDLAIDEGCFTSATFESRGSWQAVSARAVVVAAGGFQANIEMLKEAWGDVADNFIIRGTPYDKGKMLRELLDKGAKPVGDPQQCHAVAIDARAPKFDGGIVTRLDCVSFGIVVNKNAKRFYDEGEDFWPKRYAIWGRLVAQQPDQIAYSIIDAKSIDLFMPSVFPPVEAMSIREMAEKISLDPDALEKTVAVFNDAIRPGSFDPTELDSCGTEGLAIPKSHWARLLDTPPYYGYPLRPGITFTYLGVTVNEHAQVILKDDSPSPNIFAAGEIMAGNILGHGYMAGFGMTIGTVFGRIAGKEAVRYVIDDLKRS